MATKKKTKTKARTRKPKPTPTFPDLKPGTLFRFVGQRHDATFLRGDHEPGVDGCVINVNTGFTHTADGDIGSPVAVLGTLQPTTLKLIPL